ILSKLVELSQQIDHGRHEDSVTDAFAFHNLAEALRTEFRSHDLAGAECRGRKHEWQIEDVENGRRVQKNARLSIRYPVVKMVHIRPNVRVSQHNALRSARCPAGIDESQYSFRIVNSIRIGIAVNVQGFFIEHQLPRKLYLWSRQ